MNSSVLLPLAVAAPTVEMIALLILGVIASVTAVLAVTRRNPLYGAVFLIAFFITVAVLYFWLSAPFVGIMQVLVYAGAIMVLYTFIIMLLDLTPTDERGTIKASEPGQEPALGTGGKEKFGGVNLGAFVIAFSIFLCMAIPIVFAAEKGFFIDVQPPASLGINGFGSIEEVGKTMYGKYALPFEIVGVLLLVAAISGVVLAKRAIADHAEDTRGLGRGLAS